MSPYRGVNLLDPEVIPAPLGCTILRDAVFWHPKRWIPWRQGEGWAATGIVQGKTERDPARVQRLLAAVKDDSLAMPEEFSPGFSLIDADERAFVSRETVDREGQGAFRLRLLDAYGGQCAITGEHTGLVLDAAHIQPYLGPRSNHVQNELLLTKEFHALFDRGYVAITPDYRIRVSERLRADWQNGRRYYPYDGEKLISLPAQKALRPSQAALEWHYEHVFKKAG